ncbi:MAG TPA: hypothetical protein ENO22_09000 [candidate division Zixibacteria bacterium]|nr:hypothetical protein [candidate division Zixibacteria bacterium]HEQ99460.1 hypothetical protein [candidate division Zixibacteria bacterium]
MHAGSLNWGLIFIIVGLVALGWTTGRLPAEVFMRLWDLWPVLLIAIGIQMIFSKTKLAGFAYLSSILIILAAAYAVSPYWQQVTTGESLERESGTIEDKVSEEAGILEVNAEFSYRDFTLDDRAGSEIEFRYDHEALRPQYSFRVDDGRSTLRLDHQEYRWLKIFKKDELPLWKLNLPGHIPLDLYLRAEKGYCYLRMADLDVHSLDLDCERCYDVVLQFGKKIPSEPVLLDLNKSKLRVEMAEAYNVVIRDGSLLPFYLTEDLGYFEMGDDLVADTLIPPDSALVLDIAPGLRELIINRR